MRALQEVAHGVFVATSRTMHTNSTVLTQGKRALLIDPSWHPDELSGLADTLSARGWKVTGGFATHAHHDHVLWHPSFGDAPRWASHRTAELAHSERHWLVDALGADFPVELVELMGRVSGVDDFPTDALGVDYEIELVEHNGHAPGHTALWLPEQRVLIAGDMLSDIELPLPFYPDDLPAYLEALDRLAPYAARAEVVIPGHGNVGSDAADRLDADRRYIDAVLNTGESIDPRIANPSMAEDYEHLQRLARGE